MSLKAFHVLFITLAVLMVLGCGAGALTSYLESGANFYLVAAIGALTGALAMAGWEVWFIRKSKGIL